MATSKLKANTIEVPKEVLEALGLDEGVEFDVTVEDKAIVFTLHEEVALEPEQVENIRAAVAEGLEDYRAGRVTPGFTSTEEFEAYRNTEEYRKLVESE
ncbi:MAG: hypothetical protein WD273_06400 [Trueperaceae bacterium]